jgi:hypothetical protein
MVYSSEPSPLCRRAPGTPAPVRGRARGSCALGAFLRRTEGRRRLVLRLCSRGWVASGSRTRRTWHGIWLCQRCRGLGIRKVTRYTPFVQGLLFFAACSSCPGSRAGAATCLLQTGRALQSASGSRRSPARRRARGRDLDSGVGTRAAAPRGPPHFWFRILGDRIGGLGDRGWGKKMVVRESGVGTSSCANQESGLCSACANQESGCSVLHPGEGSRESAFRKPTPRVFEPLPRSSLRAAAGRRRDGHREQIASARLVFFSASARAGTCRNTTGRQRRCQGKMER